MKKYGCTQMSDRWMVMVVEANEMENQLLPGGCWSSFQLPTFSLSLSPPIHPGSNYHQLEPLNPSSLNIAKTSVWRRQWHPTPVLLPGKSHGQRSLVGCSPWGREESDTTERLHFPFSLSCIGEGNGTPLQCSCLENPGDGGAWWAAVYGVAQSWI